MDGYGSEMQAPGADRVKSTGRCPVGGMDELLGQQSLTNREGAALIMDFGDGRIIIQAR